MRPFRCAAVLVSCLLPIAAVALSGAVSAAPRTSQPAWTAAVLALRLPGGGSMRALLLRPGADSRGTLVMLAGGAGRIGIADDGTMAHADNVVVRTAPLWLARGYAVLIPDSDRNLRGSRATPAYGAAIDALVAEAHRAGPGPVVLIGTSQGAIAAVNGAAHAAGVAGLVLLEAVSRRGGSGETVFDSDPKSVTVPVLVVANAADHCPVTPPEDAPDIAAAFTGSPRVEVLRVDGGQPGRRICGSLSPHGYRGIEREMVDRVAGWLPR